MPILSDIPIIGEVFKFNSKKTENQNINILIEIVDNSTIKKMTKQSYKKSLDLF